jgi:hypothetical protein
MEILKLNRTDLLHEVWQCGNNHNGDKQVGFKDLSGPDFNGSLLQIKENRVRVVDLIFLSKVVLISFY